MFLKKKKKKNATLRSITKVSDNYYAKKTESKKKKKKKKKSKNIKYHVQTQPMFGFLKRKKKKTMVSLTRVSDNYY